MLLLCLALSAEVVREAFGESAKGWSVRHYSRLQIARELPWWAARKSGRERRECQRRWQIDLPHPRVRRGGRV